MSSVIRPSGPLPPRVYWTRRLLGVVVLVSVMVLVWWGLAKMGGGAQDPDAATPVATTSTSSATSRVPTKSTPSSGQLARAQGSSGPGVDRSGDGNRGGGPDVEKDPGKAPRTPLAEPTGDCDVTYVDMEIAVSDGRAGEPHSADMRLTSTTTPACTLSITPSTLAVRITSGDDVIWSSDECPDALLVRQMTVRQDSATTYRFTWDGHRSTETCQQAGQRAEPGGYWVEAAFIGGEPQRAYFDLT